MELGRDHLLSLIRIHKIFKHLGIAVYLAEHHHEGAKITKVGDALWRAVVIVATVGFGVTSYDIWTDNSGVYDVVRNRYLCTSSRFSFSA